MFVVTVEFAVRPGAESRFLARMQQQARDSLAAEPDCLQFDVCRSPDGPGTIFLYEIYRDEAAFQAHLATDHFKSFDAEAAELIDSKTVRTWHRVS